MKMKQLLSTSLLLLLAACTENEPWKADAGGGAAGAVSFSITGVSSGSAQTRAAIAVKEENEIKTLDIYVFAYDDNADLADAPATAPANIDESQWYLQEKWSYNSETPVQGNGTTLRSFTLGGSGMARTAVIYPQMGRFLRFFMVANAETLVNAADEQAYAPLFTELDATGAVTSVGTTAADFLKLRLRPAPMDENYPALVPTIECPLPMTGQMASTVDKVADMRTTVQGGSTDVPQTTVTALLQRAVARFDVVNKAALLTSGDFTLTSVRVRKGFRYVGLDNLIPSGSDFEVPVEKGFGKRVWQEYKEGDPAVTAGEMLTSAFYTSPTLGGDTDPMVISLYGETGRKAAVNSGLPPSIQPLDKDIEVVDEHGAKIEVKANYRYVLTIQKLSGGELVHTLSVVDWDSEVLTPDLDGSSSMPALVAADANGVVWSKSGWPAVIDFQSVIIENNTPGRTLNFLIRDCYDMAEYASNYGVRVLAPEADKNWLEDAVVEMVMGSATLESADGSVSLKVKPESEVPLKDRRDLVVQVYNVRHPELQVLFTVKNVWTPDDLPASAPLYNGIPSVELALSATTTPCYVAPYNETDGWTGPEQSDLEEMLTNVCPQGWSVPTAHELLGITGVPEYNNTYPNEYEVDAELLKAWPEGTYWTSTFCDMVRNYALVIGRNDTGKATVLIEGRSSDNPASVRCIRMKN